MCLLEWKETSCPHGQDCLFNFFMSNVICFCQIIFSFYCKGVYFPCYKSDIVLLAILCRYIVNGYCLLLYFFTIYVYISVFVRSEHTTWKGHHVPFQPPSRSSPTSRETQGGGNSFSFEAICEKLCIKTLLDKG